jgi:hypothetical protein
LWLEARAIILTVAMISYLRVFDELAGSVPVACVVRIEGSKITEDEIKNFVAKKVVLFFPNLLVIIKSFISTVRILIY